MTAIRGECFVPIHCCGSLNDVGHGTARLEIKGGCGKVVQVEWLPRRLVLLMLKHAETLVFKKQTDKQVFCCWPGLLARFTPLANTAQ